MTSPPFGGLFHGSAGYGEQPYDPIGDTGAMPVIRMPKPPPRPLTQGEVEARLRRNIPLPPEHALLTAPEVIQQAVANVRGVRPVSPPIRTMGELKERVKWCQLAALNGGAAQTLAIGATNVASTITVTRSGWVLDWLTNAQDGFTVANSLTYGQQPQTIFGDTPLSGWNNLAANPSPIDPVKVQMPAVFNVNLTNLDPANAKFIVWTMSGIPDEAVAEAMLDPAVVAFLAARGMQIARAAQAGYGGAFPG